MAQQPHFSASPWRFTEPQEDESTWLQWLVRLRWVAIVGQILTLAFTFRVLQHLETLLPLLVLTICLLMGANYAAKQSIARNDTVTPGSLLAQLLLDVFILTGFLMASGGTENPFTMLYVIHVAMASIMLSARHALLVMGFVVLANILLHIYYIPIIPQAHSLGTRTLLQLGQTIAFTVTVISVGVFVLGMANTLRRQRLKLFRAQLRTARTDRLRSLGTLAAGAAHELNTPLSTMDLRLRRIGRRHEDDQTQADLAAISSQLSRCTDIVEQLLAGAGDPSASGIETAPLQQFVQDALARYVKGTETPIETQYEATPLSVELPKVAFTQAFINLVQNAFEAQREAGVDAPITINVRASKNRAIVEIIDRGPGLPDEADRVGEPFFTTKPAGTGLGVFVARSVADGAGGGLSYSRKHPYTYTRWWFPTQGRPT